MQNQFNQLAEQWKYESKFIQSIDQKSKLNSYQQIIKMGKDAVPIILNDLKINGPNDWFYALSKITGENPITKDIEGNMIKMTQAWIDWYNNQ